MKTTLYEIAYARSGDKGGNANIGVIAYSLEGFYFLNSFLTEKKLQSYFQELEIHSIHKYPMKNLWAINFVLKGILGEGGSNSLRIDAQGKALGQALLEMPIEISENMLEKCQRGNISG